MTARRLLLLVLALVPAAAAPAEAKHTPFTSPLPIPEVLGDAKADAPPGKAKKKPSRCERRARRIKSKRKRGAALRRCRRLAAARKRRAETRRRKALRRCQRRARGERTRARRRGSLHSCSRRYGKRQPKKKKKKAAAPKPQSSLRLQMRESDVQILPGEKTRMWTFNGSFPGPTIKVRSGTPAKVTFDHRLPAAADKLSIHNHGNHSPPSEDGQPEDFLIPPGGSRTYTYPLVEDGKPERAAFQWYHDHRMDRTARNLWRGLAGMFIIEDDFEARLPLPKGEYDVPLMIVDRQFDDRNQLTNPFPEGGPQGGSAPPSDQAVGDHILVNGAPQPHFDVADRRYRLRILNASNFRSYDFRLSNGQAMTQIATESGLLPAPVNRSSVTLGPAERAEVVVDFNGLLGQNVVLTSSAGPAMQFRVRRDAKEDNSRVDFDTLRPVPRLDVPAAPTQTWNLGLGFDSRKNQSAWTINGQVFDHHQVAARIPLGSTQSWQITNPTNVRHLMHSHDVDMQLVSRNGRPPQPWEEGPKDTFLLEPGDTIVVAGKFTDYVGKYVFHCHMLEHEDNGMMVNFEVYSNGGPAAATATLLRRAGDNLALAPLALVLLAFMGRALLVLSRRVLPLRPLRALLPVDARPAGGRAARVGGAAALAGVATAHLVEAPHKLIEAPYLGWSFLAACGGAAVMAALLASGRRTRLAWSAAGALSIALLGGYVLSRTAGLPGIEDHVGHWAEPAALAALVSELAVLALASAALAPRPVRRALAPVAALLTQLGPRP